MVSGRFRFPVCSAWQRFSTSALVNSFRRRRQANRGQLPRWPSGGITVDLNKIDSLTGREAKLLEDFLRAIQMMRQDFNGRVLTIRHNDLRLLSLLLHQAEDDFSRRLTDLGVTTV